METDLNPSTATTPTPPTTSITPTEGIPKSKISKKTMYIIGAAVAAVAVTSGLVWYFKYHKKKDEEK